MSALGTEFKYGIKVQLQDGKHLKDCDFEVTTYVHSNKAVTFSKSDTTHIKPIDDDTYKVIIDSDSALTIGRGRIMAKIVIHVPDDPDYSDGRRTEIYSDLYTGWTIA